MFMPLWNCLTYLWFLFLCMPRCWKLVSGWRSLNIYGSTIRNDWNNVSRHRWFTKHFTSLWDADLNFDCAVVVSQIKLRNTYAITPLIIRSNVKYNEYSIFTYWKLHFVQSSCNFGWMLCVNSMGEWRSFPSTRVRRHANW